jgi:hypothetical protein
MKYVCLKGSHVHDQYGLHVNQLFYPAPAMLRRIGVHLYLHEQKYLRAYKLMYTVGRTHQRNPEFQGMSAHMLPGVTICVTLSDT